MKNKAKYKKVKYCKKRKFFGGIDALWSADDHLLLVQNSGYTQSYKRFFFNDIQAMFARVTNRWKYYALFWGVALFLSLLCAFFAEEVERWVWLGVAACFLIGFAVNWHKGPSCKATIVTRVQTHSLPVIRLKKAEKVFASLRSRIEAVQGVLKPETLVGASSISFGRVPNAKQPKHPGRPEKTIDHSYSGVFHILFFSSLLIIAGLNGLQLYVRNMSITLGETLLFVAAVVLMVLALARQHTSTMSGMLRKNTWVALALVFVLVGLGYVDVMIAMFEGIDNAGGMQNQLDMLNLYVNRDFSANAFFKFSLIFTAVSLSLVAIPGLWQTTRFRKEQAGSR